MRNNRRINHSWAHAAQFYFTESNDTSRMKIYEQISRIPPLSSHRVSRQLELEHFLRPSTFSLTRSFLGSVEEEKAISQSRSYTDNVLSR